MKFFENQIEASTVDLLSSGKSVFIYPNPVSDILYFAEPSTYQIIDLTGSIVKSELINKCENVVLSDLLSGIYIISYNNGDKLNSETLIIK